MPSPFPGMDPFLERPNLWPAMHSYLALSLARALNRNLPAAYVAKPNERVYILHEEERTFYPDSVVIGNSSVEGSMSSGTALAVADRPLQLTVEPEEITERFVEVVRADAPGRIVATIELLSPHNKTKSHEGRRQYLAKQKERLSSRTHLIEIDLLRKGPHTVAAPAYWLNQQDPWHYVVSLHRGGAGRGRFEAWTTNIRNRLPRFYVPLEGSDEPVTVDLQALLAECYVDGRFEQQIDYSGRVPPPAFTKADQEWIDDTLKAAQRK